MSTKTKHVNSIILKATSAFIICFMLIQVLINTQNQTESSNVNSVQLTEDLYYPIEKNQDSVFMGYLLELPDAGVTKVLYGWELSKANEFKYSYSSLTDAPCVGGDVIIQECEYKSSSRTVEVHTLTKTKSSMDGDYTIPDVIICTVTPAPNPEIKKIYENENVSAEIQQDAKFLSEKYNVPIEILLGIAYKETRYTSGVISKDTHDYGFCQIRDVNHDWLEKEIGRELDFLNSEYDSMEAACFMLRNFKNKYNTSSWGFILLCYNGGEDYANNLASQGIWGSKYTRDVLSKAYSLGWSE